MTDQTKASIAAATLFCLCCAWLVIFSGCSAAAKEEMNVAKAAAVKVEAARPDQLKIVSRRKHLGNYTTAVIIEDTETGQKYIIVEGSYGDAVAITPIKKDEQR